MGCGTIISSYKLKYNLNRDMLNVRCITELERGTVITCGGDGKLYVWSKEFNELIETIKGHFSQIVSMVFLDKNIFVTASKDMTIRKWQISEGKIMTGESYKLDSQPFVLSRISKKTFALGCQGGIKYFSFTPLEELYFLTLASPIETMVCLKDGRVAGNSLYKIILWKPNTDNIYYIEGHEKSVRSVYQLKDGRFLSGAEDKKIFVWDIKHNFRIKELEGHKGPVISFYQLREGNLVSGDQYSMICIWDLELNNILQVLVEEGSILGFYQLRNSNLCSVSSASEIKVWSYE